MYRVIYPYVSPEILSNAYGEYIPFTLLQLQCHLSKDPDYRIGEYCLDLYILMHSDWSIDDERERGVERGDRF